MCQRRRYTDLAYMGGTGSCEPMRLIFGSVIQSYYSSLNIKLGAHRTSHVPKTPVYLFDLYGRYRILWTDEDNFQQCYLELVHMPKNQRSMCLGVNRTFHVLKSPVYRLDLYGRYQILRTDIAHFQYQPVCSSLCSDAIVFTPDGRTDRQTDIAEMSQNFALIKCLQGTQGLRSLFRGVTNVLSKLIYPL